eukprot:13283365-Heterocapsa_arctica.AAC.1
MRVVDQCLRGIRGRFRQCSCALSGRLSTSNFVLASVWWPPLPPPGPIGLFPLPIPPPVLRP